MLSGGDKQFLIDMTLDQRGSGLYGATISGDFNAPILPQGGITTAVALHAAVTELGRDDLTLASCNTVFAAQVTPGPAEIEVVVLRDGRSASQVRATLRSVDGDPAGHEVTATFAAPRDTDFEFVDTVPPAAGPPDAYADRWSEADEDDDPFGGRPTFWQHFESRHVTGHMPWDPPWPLTTSEVVSWMRWYDTPVDASGATSPFALIPPLDTMPGAVFERFGPRSGDEVYLVPSVDLAVQVFDTDLSGGSGEGWMLRRNTSRWAGRGLAAADMEIFSQDGRLLAYATQLMHIRRASRDIFATADRDPAPKVAG